VEYVALNELFSYSNDVDDCVFVEHLIYFKNP